MLCQFVNLLNLLLDGQLALFDRIHHREYVTVNNVRTDTYHEVVNIILDLKSRNYTIRDQRCIRDGLRMHVGPRGEPKHKGLPVDTTSTTTSIPNELDTSSNQDLIFTEDQQMIINISMEQIRAGLQDLTSPLEKPHRKQLLQLILGPPGAGKSVVLNYISNKADDQALINSISYPIIINTATTGAAASNLRPGSRTVHNQFGIKIDQTNENTDEFLPKLTVAALAKLRSMFQNAFSICIDECSMLTSVMLYRVSERLKEITNNHTEPFGGLDITLVGNFSQLPPAAGVPLYKDAIDFHLEPHKFTAGSPRYFGTLLFQQFKVFKLETIQRSGKDPAHNERLARIRNDGIIDEDIINSLKVLSEADFPEFAHAPIIATSNSEINALLHPIMIQFARSRGQCVLKWKKDLTDKSKKIVQNLPEKSLDDLYEKFSVGTYQYFVCGADAVAYLTENICPSVGLGNGVPVTLHSLVFESEEAEKVVKEKIRQSSCSVG